MLCRRLATPFFIALSLITLASCGGEDEAKVDPRYEEAGAFGVGNTTITKRDEVRGRDLTIEIWYPQDGASANAVPVENFVVDSSNRAIYVQLLADAPASCPSKESHSLRDAVPAVSGAPFPLLVFSHCHNCTRFSSFAIAERLASHGFVVAAPDHTDNTLFDDLAGNGVELNSDFLQVRALDMSFVIDTMLAGEANLEIDPERIGVYGHSFGAVTTGLVLQDDPRPIAGFAIATPMENPLLEGVEMAKIDEPVGFLVAVEDNSITELGNLFIRQNYDAAPTKAWKGEVADAGHWSFSNICALHPQFAACCGTDERQTDNMSFTYLPIESGVAIAQAYVTAFFAAHVNSDANAARYLGSERFTGVVAIEER